VCERERERERERVAMCLLCEKVFVIKSEKKRMCV
jgi:hypothetical protein